MTEKQVSYFEKAYETRNIATAAEALFVSRSVISRAILELENEFGITFFQRSRNGIVPTEAGKMMHGMILQMHSNYNALANRFREFKDADANRHLRVGLTPTNVRVIAPLLFGPFHDQHPDVNIKVIEQQSDGLVTLLSSGEADVIAVTGSPSLRTETLYNALPLYDTRIVLAMSEKDPMADKSLLSVMDLLSRPLGFLSVPIPAVERVITNSFDAVNQTPNIIIRTSAIEVLRQMTQAGQISTILPDDMVRDWRGVVGIPLDFINRVSTHKLVWNNAVPPSSACTDFIDFMRRRFDHGETAPAPLDERETRSAGLSSDFFAELLDLPACKSKGYCDNCGRCEH